MSILIFVLSEVVIVSVVFNYSFYRKLTNEKREVERLTKLATEYKAKYDVLQVEKMAAPELTTMQYKRSLEEEVDEDTYNRTINEWIYGAKEEGGIDV